MSVCPACPPYLLPLLSLFSAHGERAYPVGGCVRDTLMGVVPHDWDVAVTTIPEETMRLCEEAGYRTIPTGLQHGTVTVLVPHSGHPADREGGYDLIECTTCRTEGGYTDGRHPDAVSFTGRIRDDLARRDFTVNAMAFDREDAPGQGERLRVLDLFGGQKDLEDGVIRAVGDPDTRFSEDGLRLMRGVRFAVRLGFAIEAETRAAMLRKADGLARISRERISDEFQKILTGPRPEEGVTLLIRLGLMPHVLPRGISSGGMGNLSALPADFSLRMACLQWGLSEKDLLENLAGLRLPNVVSKTIRTLVGSRALTADPTPYGARRWRQSLGGLALPALSVRLALGGEDPDILQTMSDLVRRSEAAGDPICIGDLAVNGSDLIAAGIRPGQTLRHMLEALLEVVLADPMKNTREALMEEVYHRRA